MQWKSATTAEEYNTGSENRRTRMSQALSTALQLSQNAATVGSPILPGQPTLPVISAPTSNLQLNSTQNVQLKSVVRDIREAVTLNQCQNVTINLNFNK